MRVSAPSLLPVGALVEIKAVALISPTAARKGTESVAALTLAALSLLTSGGGS